MEQGKEQQELKGKLDIIASQTFPKDSNLVYVVDFLNKSLKRKGYIFGITKADPDQMTIVIYETDK